jgi:IS605 OrfB family transposase
MADTQPRPTTQRAYTLRLRGATPNDHAWRDALWATHEAVNRGAKVFGDWLLTLRGGLCHTLADVKSPQGKGKPDRNATDDARKARRILLALSWLSVESERGSPTEYIVAHDLDKQSGTRSNWKTVESLKEILKNRGLNDNQVEAWIQDCSASLMAAIRDDAVWVNRSKTFDSAAESACPSLTRDEVWDMLERFFGSKEAYFAPTTVAEEEPAEREQEKKAKDLVQKAGQWLSNRFGTGKGADFARMATVYEKIAEWAGKAAVQGADTVATLANALRPHLNSEGQKKPQALSDLDWIIAISSYPGHSPNPVHALLRQNQGLTKQQFEDLEKKAKTRAKSCVSKTGSKGPRPYSNAILKDIELACGFTYLQDGGPARHCNFAVMLDHAARRVSLAHTWIKRAEAERRRFEEDARRIAIVPESTKNWLDKFCQERSGASGAVDTYRIRRRAKDGWKEVVAAWAKDDCKTEDNRIAAARSLQDDPDIDKFGDIQLFEALADDDALCVWHKDGDPEEGPDPQPLIDYVLATEAEFKKRRFKVPAYRHPDALLHPIFCDFGYSRWDVGFAAHRNPDDSCRVRDVNLALWDKHTVRDDIPLCWSCKRLFADLALASTGTIQTNGPSVSRADRLGRAAIAVDRSKPVRIAGLFDQQHWNGRLQAPRSQLDEIARHVDRHGWDAKALGMLARIRWLLSFSAQLVQQGPWFDFCGEFDDHAPARPFVSRQGEYAVVHGDNEKRKGHAKLILSRLPSLRVLSVDLGHRYAAACAVWETLSAGQIKAACQTAGHAPPKAEDLYLHLKEGGRTVVYRRIGPDPHPAAWARLERQFLIKLQGEDREARPASDAEKLAVEELERAVGCEPPKHRSLQVDDLMSETVRTMRLALQRHGRRARIAFNLTADKKLLPGGREESLIAEGRAGLVVDTLADWYALFTSKGWTDPWAQQQWQTHIAPLLQGNSLPQIPDDAEATPKARKRYQADLTDKLRPVAESLAKNDALCRKLHCLWAARWRENDLVLRKRLRWLRDWLLPRGKRGTDRAIRHVGGLSLTRIATIKSLYQVQKAFHMRAEPEDLRKNIPAKGDDALRHFGQSTLDVMEHMREQRVKQLASRIAEAALGIGRIKIPKKGRMPRRLDVPKDRPCHAVVIENLTNYRPEETRTRRENRQLMTWSSGKVKKYLAEACQLHGLHLREVQAAYTSRQDSRTGAPGIRCQDVPVADVVRQGGYLWKRVKKSLDEVKKRKDRASAENRLLADLCSRWDEEGRIWTDAHDAQWTLGQDGKWAQKNGGAVMPKKAKTPAPVRIPQRGGDLFVSADAKSSAAKGLQADLNAAANIGLRALIDPDFPGKWWYVPCDSAKRMPRSDKVMGSILDAVGPLQAVDPEGDAPTKGQNRRKKDKEFVNLWRDPQGAMIQGVAGEESWQPTPAYWNSVEYRVVQLLRRQAGLPPE